MKKTVETYLPIFSGFYHTIWDFSEGMLEYELEYLQSNQSDFPELENIPLDYIEDNLWEYCNYSEFESDIVEAIAGEIPSFFDEICPGLVTNCTVQTIRRPREYNFANDAADVEMEIDLPKLQTFLADNKEELSAFIYKRYTSRSGFISYYSNSLEDWKEETQNFTELEGHYLGALLEFVAQVEHGGDSEWSLFNHCEMATSDCYLSINYDKLKTDFWEEKKSA